MDHNFTVERPESRVLNVYALGVGGEYFSLSAVHTVAINTGDTVTWAGTTGMIFTVEVLETEWWVFDDSGVNVYECTTKLLASS